MIRTVPFAAGTQYKVYARARDSNGFLTPLPYPNVTFQLDQAAPTVWVSTPADASTVYAFDAVEGTAADTGGAGLAGAEVYLMRLADGKWWNFQTAAWGEVPVASAQAQSVQLAGDFNSWDPSVNPLKKYAKGVWKINLNLSPGRYEYRFLVDGQWQNDPQCSEHVANPFGEENCLLIVD